MTCINFELASNQVCFSSLNPTMSVTLGHVLLLRWPWVHSAPQETRVFLPLILNVPQPLHRPAPLPTPPPPSLRHFNMMSRSRDWISVTSPGAPGFEADSLSSVKPPQVVDRWIGAAPAGWPLMSDCFNHRCWAERRHSFLTSVYIFTFLKEGLLSYFFFSLPYLFLTVFQWKPMCPVWPPLPFFSEWH